MFAAIQGLDYIPAFLASLLPAGWGSGFHQHFPGGITYCFPGPLWWESIRYLRSAIAAYTITFFAIALLSRLMYFSIGSSRSEETVGDA
jgi:hypothetical protein